MQHAKQVSEILREHGPMIARISASYEANAAMAQELTQEILMAVWQALPSHRGESSIKTFVARIAHNRALTHAARHAKQPKTSLLSDELIGHDIPVEQSLIDTERRERLLNAVRL